MNPVIRVSRNVGGISVVATASWPMRAMRKQPATFTAKVPYGNDVPNVRPRPQPDAVATERSERASQSDEKHPSHPPSLAFEGADGRGLRCHAQPQESLAASPRATRRLRWTPPPDRWVTAEELDRQAGSLREVARLDEPRNRRDG
jgi:hypothetical protein